MEMDKFSAFKILDLATFGGPAIVVSGLAVYAISNGSGGDGLVILILTALCFWFVYGMLVYSRKKFLDQISFITKHKIAVVINEFSVKKEDVENITTNTINSWYAATGYADCAKVLEGMYVVFKPYPVTHHSVLGKLAGYLLGDTAVIGFKDSVEHTALAHEFGHMIHEKWTGTADNDACHKFMSEHQLS